jgi:phospholipid/cholesterol/gamma-HCH transport system substrate-binding protein
MRRPRLTASRRIMVGAVSLVVVIAAAFAFGIDELTSTPTKTITADFTEAPGIYTGNHVDVLGIPIGSVTAVTPHPTYVSVVMQVDQSVKIPAHAIAALMAPDLVNDRYIQLDPVYTHGAVMKDHGTIPMAHTALPQSVDQTISVLDQLIQALGPTGADKSGALSQFIHDVATTVGHNGPSFHTTITALGKALGDLSNDGPSITSILDNVGTFTSEAAQNDAAFSSFANDLASVSSVIAADSSDIGTSLTNLQQILGQVTSFINNNKAALASVLTNLDTFSSTVLSQQQALSSAFNLGGLVLQNLNQALVPAPGGGYTLNIRYDPSLDTPAFINEICGDEETRLLTIGAEQAKADELNVACFASAALAQVAAPPNANQGPNMSMSALVPSS